MAESTKGISPKEFAKTNGFDEKSVRRVLRSLTDDDNQPGSGGRWKLTPTLCKVLLERMNRSHNKKVVVLTPEMLKK